MKCGNCDVEFPNGAKFCPACGASAFGSSVQAVEPLEAPVAAVEQFAEADGVMDSSEKVVSAIRFAVSFSLTAVFMAIVVIMNTSMGTPAHFSAVLSGQAIFRLTDFCLIPFAFIPFMGWAAATHIMGIVTGDKSIMARRICRYPVRILSLAFVVAGDALLAYTFVAWNMIPYAVWVAFVGVVTIAAYWWIVLRSRVNGSVKIVALDENPLLDALILSVGFFAQGIAANGVALVVCLLLLPYLIRFIRTSTLIMLFHK